MENTIYQRVNDILDKKNLSANALSKILDMPQVTVNNYVSGKRKISFELIERIAQAFPDINTQWLLSGEGEMFIPKALNIPGLVRASELESKPLNNESSQSVMSGMLPESTFRFAAGQTQLINETERVNRYWFLPDCTDCEAVAPVAGTSMLPNLPPGCFVALKRYNIADGNPNTIPFGQIFGIVVEDEQTGEYHGHIKVLRRHKDPELAKNYWIAHSFNTEEYDDFDISLSQVRSLWIVKQHIVSDTIY